jgi:hypothetical protein
VNDKITALDGTTRQPPNNVTFTVNGVQSGWYVMVAPYDAGNIDYNQLTLNGTLSGAAVTSVVVNEAIPANTPSSGTIRIKRANGAYTRHPYSAVNTGTKTFHHHVAQLLDQQRDDGYGCVHLVHRPGCVWYIDLVQHGADEQPDLVRRGEVWGDGPELHRLDQAGENVWRAWVKRRQCHGICG